MKKIEIVSISFNLLVTAAFVSLNIWALRSNLEETFISLAVIYGIVMLMGNLGLMFLKK